MFPSPYRVEKEVIPPALILLALDSSYDDSEALLALHQTKSTWPCAKTVIPVEVERQYRMVQTVGAGLILLEVTIAIQMLKRIDELLSRAGPLVILLKCLVVTA